MNFSKKERLFFLYPDGVTTVTTSLLTPHKDKCHTITFDNGKEFEEHEKLQQN
jgi:IS30 family transposase